MNQITQKLKDGQVTLTEVPVPAMGDGEILVRNIYSCISVGTEASTVTAARKSYLGKIRQRPAQARQVWEKLLATGPVQTYRAVMKKLDAHSPLGYSCVGQVIGVGAAVAAYSVGDYVACAGRAAGHAEMVAVSENLCVRLDPNTDLKAAAYNALGAIALQGVRQADLKLGEACAVIGLGVLGQLTCALLRAGGIRVIGIDVNPGVMETARRQCVDLALLRDDLGLEDRIVQFTGGLGCDAVIITAASTSLDPVNLAGSISRKRASIVVVGAVPTGFDREPHYYQKELSLKMSCSYGPGRYDPDYEEKGCDYPPGYVRWTENRNMAAFQDLIRAGRLDLQYLTTHVFKLADAVKAYDMILAKTEPFLGVLIEYDQGRSGSPVSAKIRSGPQKSRELNSAVIGFIGAGSYAQSHLLPHFQNSRDVILKGVATGTPTGSRSAADRFGFEFCTTRAEDVLQCEAINTIIIATRHDSHGRYVVDALKAGKHVFVEKPLCLRLDELEEIAQVYREAWAKGQAPHLMVGYNRRFSPVSEFIKANLTPAPMAMVYRVNAGAIPSESWIQDPDVGGGRILGEVCHFVDLLNFFSGSLPYSVHAMAMHSAGGLKDTVSIALNYANGAVGTVHYFANGSKHVPKEHVEIYQNGMTAVLSDFREATCMGDGRNVKKRLMAQNKGQQSEVGRFIKAVSRGGTPLIPFEELYSTSLMCFAALESLRIGAPVQRSEVQQAFSAASVTK